MSKRSIFAIACVIIGVSIYFFTHYFSMVTSNTSMVDDTSNTQSSSNNTSTAILAGGCFWCVEADLEKLHGVVDVVSGYSGGTIENPTYESYSAGGHREVIEVTYDPRILSYAGLLEYFIKHIDPTDTGGSFNDRGEAYSPAVYYENDSEKNQQKR